jgi:hypothetical protein
MGVSLDARAAANEVDGVNMDALGIFYCCLAVVWTIILASGMVFLYRRRDMPILKIRGLSLSFGAVILLHMYWLAVQFGYLYGRWMAASIEYWIMGIWLPFGIALFHASNSRFLYVAKMQKRFIHEQGESRRLSRRNKKKTLLEKYQLLDYTTKMLTVVCIGMGFQVSNSSSSYAASPARLFSQRRMLT